ncbi:hypothetical protein [Paraburkholderia sp. SIMBA_054]|uniref:hypothetical protein n=1 Tax=Paraburkholderia sp. SIMBA_054 TaxID=3085795 RepID=UPI00397A19C3
MNQQAQRSQIVAAQRIGLAILETIDEAGELGAPAGPLFAALQAQGASLSQFESLMAPLVARGLVTLESHLYTMTSSGREFMGKLRAAVGAATPAGSALQS